MHKTLLVVCAYMAMVGTAAAQQSGEKLVLACIENASAGLNVKQNKSGYSTASFHERKFTMILEGAKLTVKIDNKQEIYTCSSPWLSQPTLTQCMEKFYTMGLDLRTLSFTRAEFFGPLGGDAKDSLMVSHGECQRF